MNIILDNFMTGTIYNTENLKNTNAMNFSFNMCKERDENIKDINIIVPNKIVEVTFADGLKEKMICQEEDTFNFRNCLFIAIAKHLYKKDYTLEGIEWKAFELRHLKKYVKIVDTALKAFDRKQKDIAKAEKECEEKLKFAKARHERKLAKISNKKQTEKEKQIEIQKEAYIQAMKAMKENKGV